MPTDPTCVHRRLVTSEHCHVVQCEHGTIHLSLGDVTLRMPATAFLSIATALGIASHRVHAVGEEAAGATRMLC